jgi:hypothetical protein
VSAAVVDRDAGRESDTLLHLLALVDFGQSFVEFIVTKGAELRNRLALFARSNDKLDRLCEKKMIIIKPTRTIRRVDPLIIFPKQMKTSSDIHVYRSDMLQVCCPCTCKSKVMSMHRIQGNGRMRQKIKDVSCDSAFVKT